MTNDQTNKVLKQVYLIPEYSGKLTKYLQVKGF